MVADLGNQPLGDLLDCLGRFLYIQIAGQVVAAYRAIGIGFLNDKLPGSLATGGGLHTDG